MSETRPELQAWLNNAPELICLKSSERSYMLTAKLDGGDNMTRKISVDIKSLIDPTLDDFYRIIRVDDFPFELVKINVNMQKRTIAINLIAFEYL